MYKSGDNSPTYWSSVYDSIPSPKELTDQFLIKFPLESSSILVRDLMVSIENSLNENDIHGYTSKNFEPGHWINPVNNDWITQRVYLYVKTKNKEEIESIVDNMNNKLLKINTEIILNLE
jgi:hypothetical protein